MLTFPLHDCVSVWALHIGILSYSPPDVAASLNWIYGYKCRGARKTVAYTHTKEIAYPAACVGVLYSRERNSQAFLSGHTDEITAIAVHAEVRGNDVCVCALMRNVHACVSVVVHVW